MDIGRDGLELCADVVGCAIRRESWMKTENKANLSVGEGLKETTQSNQSQVYGNQRGGGRLGFQLRKPNNQDKSSGFGGKYQMGGKRKNRPGNQG